MNLALVDLDDLRRLIAEAVAPPMPTEVLTRDEVAAVLRIHPRDLRRLVLEGGFPAGFKVGRRLRWRRATVERWIARAELDASRRNRLHGAGMDHTGALP